MAACKPVRVLIAAIVVLVLVVCYVHLCQSESLVIHTPLVFFRLDEQLSNISVVETRGVHEPRTTAARFVSSVLNEKGIVDKVTGMYTTSKNLQYRYDNPSLKKTKFTIVMPIHNHTSNLYKIFRHYCSSVPEGLVDKMLVVWNNVGVPIPSKLESTSCSFPIVFLPQSRNSLNNRFIPFDQIETECIFSVDDDVLVSSASLQFGYKIWKSFPHHLVGFLPRSHKFVGGQYYYKHKPVKHGELYSIILTVAMFFNHKYLSLYTNDSPKEISQFVDKYNNGEDISMVGVVANYLREIDQPQCACIWVKEKIRNIKNRKKRSKGLFNRWDHVQERNNCINMLAMVYGGLPIQYCSLEVSQP